MNKHYLGWATFVAVNGGLLFGLNMAGISGAVSFIQNYFSLNDIALGLAVSSLTVGCLIGALFAGLLSDKYGRKKMLIFTAFVFIISALGCSVAHSLSVFIISRIIGGLAVGAASVLCPTYITEIAPADKRGSLVSYNQLAITIGILLAYAIDYILVDANNNWRLMLSVPMIFGVIFLILLIVSFPESPRWLVRAGDEDKAKGILKKIGGEEFASNEVASISTSLKKDNTSRAKLGDLFKGKMGYVLLLGTLLAVFQQITGINAVINYAPTIFEKTGMSSYTALLQSIIVGLVNFLATIIAVRLVDKKGRKILLLWGAAGMTISLTFLSLTFIMSGIGNTWVLISILTYIVFFAASLAPVMWIVTSEMYPTKYRGAAMSFSTAVSWICTLVVVQFFPWILNNLGGTISFGIFAFFSLAAYIFIRIYIPETKGKSLEQIETELGLSTGGKNE
nr:sugar porter family MFS transporter [uncultured Draconibacterium sp.]